MMNFIDTPVVGDVVNAAFAPGWQWDGEKWLGGPPTQKLPAGDGNTYLRGPAAQGDWVLGTEHKLLLPATGATEIVYDVPDGARLVRMNAVSFSNGGANQALAHRISFDGTTFLSASGDYMIGGVTTYAGSQATVPGAPVAYAAGYLAPTSDYNHIIPQSCDAIFTLRRGTTGAYLGCRFAGMGYYNSTLYYGAQWMGTMYYPLANPGLQVRKIKFFNYAGAAQLAFGPGSMICLEVIA